MKAIMMMSQAHIDKMAFRPEKQTVRIFVAVILTALMSVSTSLAAESYAVGSSRVRSQVRSSVGTLKGPPTSVRNELVSRPPDIYFERNLGITGNVASGRHFRGDVPYSAATDFQAPLGSATLNSFIRQSTRTPNELLIQGRSMPYYLPSKTVSSIRRGGGSGLKSPVIPSQSATPVYESPTTVPMLAPPPIVEQPMRGRKRPFSFYSDEIAIKLSKKIKENNLQIVDELLYDYDRAAEIKRILREFEQRENEEFEKEVLRKLQIEKPELKKSDLQIFREEGVIGELKKRPELETEKKTLEQKTAELTKFIEEELGVTPRERKAEVEDGLDDLETKPDEPKLTFQEQLDEMIPVDHKRAMELLGEHKDFNSLANAKFATYRNLADEFMKEGKYYDARDTWKLAEIWIKGHPDTAMGKGDALFAAGEYISSAYYTEQALAYSPEYAMQKTNLLQLIDEATFKAQMGELVGIYNISKSYKLGFLLAHLNYQDNKLDKAAEYLVAIKEQMNQSQAYRYLKKAVEMAIAQEGDK